MEVQSLLRNIKKLLNDEKNPQEIKASVNRYYKDYNDAYRACLSNVEFVINGNQKLMEELNNIAVYMNKDCVEDMENTEEIEEISCCDRKEKIYEDIKFVIGNLVSQYNNINISGSLKPIIDVDENREEKNEELETIQRAVNNDVINTEFYKGIIGSILTEIDSSKKFLIFKLSDISKKVDITYAKEKFVKEVEVIEDNVKQQLPLDIKNALNKQGIVISNEVYSLYIEYMKEHEPKQISQREKFMQGLHSEVDESKAIKKMDERNSVEKDRNFQSLEGNVIE